MSRISDIVTQIRTAVYGRDVRTNIADGIEICYSNVQEGKTLAETAANNANTKASEANTAANNANTAANRAETAATLLENYITVSQIGSTEDYRMNINNA